MYTILMTFATGLMIWMAYPYLKHQIRSIHRIRNWRSWKQWKPFVIIALGAISLSLTVWFSRDAFYSSYKQIAANVSRATSGDVILNKQRRNALESKSLEDWLDRCQAMNTSMHKREVSRAEFDEFLATFIEYAETTWSDQQVVYFNDNRIMRNRENFGPGPEISSDEHDMYVQLFGIIGVLAKFIEDNKVPDRDDLFGL